MLAKFYLYACANNIFGMTSKTNGVVTCTSYSCLFVEIFSVNLTKLFVVLRNFISLLDLNLDKIVS